MADTIHGDPALSYVAVEELSYEVIVDAAGGNKDEVTLRIRSALHNPASQVQDAVIHYVLRERASWKGRPSTEMGNGRRPEAPISRPVLADVTPPPSSFAAYHPTPTAISPALSSSPSVSKLVPPPRSNYDFACGRPCEAIVGSYGSPVATRTRPTSISSGASWSRASPPTSPSISTTKAAVASPIWSRERGTSSTSPGRLTCVEVRCSMATTRFFPPRMKATIRARSKGSFASPCGWGRAAP